MSLVAGGLQEIYHSRSREPSEGRKTSGLAPPRGDKSISQTHNKENNDAISA